MALVVRSVVESYNYYFRESIGLDAASFFCVTMTSNQFCRSADGRLVSFADAASHDDLHSYRIHRNDSEGPAVYGRQKSFRSQIRHDGVQFLPSGGQLVTWLLREFKLSSPLSVGWLSSISRRAITCSWSDLSISNVRASISVATRSEWSKSQASTCTSCSKSWIYSTP